MIELQLVFRMPGAEKLQKLPIFLFRRTILYSRQSLLTNETIQDWFVLPVQGKSEIEKGRKFLKAQNKKLTKVWDKKCQRHIWANLLVDMLNLHASLKFKPIKNLSTSKEAFLNIADLPLAFQIRVGKQLWGGHNLPPYWNRFYWTPKFWMG